MPRKRRYFMSKDKKDFLELKLTESNSYQALDHVKYKVSKCASHNDALDDADYLNILGQLESLKSKIKNFYSKFES